MSANIKQFQIAEPVTPVVVQSLRAGLFTYAEAADILRVSTRTVKRLVAAKKLATIPVLGSRRILHTELIRFMGEGAR